MKVKVIVAILASPAILTGCTRAPNIASNSRQVEAEPFRGQLYRSIDGSTSLTLISADECEFNQGGTILLCKYTKQSDALRVVATVMGTNQVIYYRLIDEGVQDNNGAVLLSPDRYAQAKNQIDQQQLRLAQERAEEQKRQQEAAAADREHQRQIDELKVKARQRQHTIASEPILGGDNQLSVKLALSDVDYTTTDFVGTQTVWFGDIASLRYYTTGPGIYQLWVYTKAGGQYTLSFPSEAREQKFQSRLADAMSDWKQRYPMLAR